MAYYRNHNLRKRLKLSIVEMEVLIQIYESSNNNIGWCMKSPQEICDWLDIKMGQLNRILQSLCLDGHIDYGHEISTNIKRYCPSDRTRDLFQDEFNFIKEYEQ